MDVVVRIGIVVVVIGTAAGFGLWWHRRDGQVKRGTGAFAPERLRALGLKPEAGSPGASMALLLSSPTCAPCVQVKAVLEGVATRRSNFTWVSVDAGDHLDLARDHNVMRVPTLFVLDARGRIVARTSGVPAERDLEAVLDRPKGGWQLVAVPATNSATTAESLLASGASRRQPDA